MHSWLLLISSIMILNPLLTSFSTLWCAKHFGIYCLFWFGYSKLKVDLLKYNPEGASPQFKCACLRERTGSRLDCTVQRRDGFIVTLSVLHCLWRRLRALVWARPGLGSWFNHCQPTAWPQENDFPSFCLCFLICKIWVIIAVLTSRDCEN